MRRAACLALCLLCGDGARALAQMPDGYVAAGVDALPNVEGSPVELRARVFVDEQPAPFGPLTVRFAGSVDVGVRSGIVSGGRIGVRSGIVSVASLAADDPRPDPIASAADDPRPDPNMAFFLHEAYAEMATARAELRAGYSRIVWGRLDEVQPTDVVNPLDLARFFFEGRSEARMAVPLVRGRLFFGERATVDALVVPAFRRGRFDRLGEPTSPFNLEPPAVSIVRQEPAASLGNLQGGARVSATIGRLDVSVSTFRGFDAFGTYIPQPPTPTLVQVFPRYTMIGGDFETATRGWAWRGEFAYFSSDQDRSDGGIGVDRRAGEYHLSGTVLVHHEPHYTSTSLVAAADRAFARERYRIRAFGVYNVTEQATFLRTIASIELRDNLTLEGSIGWFFGDDGTAGRDIIGRFSDRDFLYARLKLHF